MNSNPDPQSIGESLARLIPRPIGWLQSERDLSRKKFTRIIGGLVVAAVATVVTGFYLVYVPEYAAAIWALESAESHN